MGSLDGTINKCTLASSYEDMTYLYLFLHLHFSFTMTNYVETCLDFSQSTCLNLNSLASFGVSWGGGGWDITLSPTTPHVQG